MSKLKLYHIRVIVEMEDGSIFWTDHAYFEDDDFFVEEADVLEIYDPDTCILRVYTSIAKNGTRRWSRR